MALFNEILTAAGDWLAVSLEALERLVPKGLFLVALSVVLLMAILMLLVVYIACLRMLAYLNLKRREARFAIWNRLVPAYLAQDAELSQLRSTVGRFDMQLFGDYCRPYLLDIEGEDRTRLLELMDGLRFGEYLINLMSHRQYWRRAFAIHFLGLIRYQPALPLVRRRLYDGSELVRYAAAQALMRMRDTSYVSAVLQQLGKSAFDRQDRISAILFEFGPGILPELLRILREEELENWVIVIIIRIFKHHSYIEATWDLAELAMTTGDKEVRLAGLNALAEIEDPVLVALFEDLARGEDPVICATSARALGRIGGIEHLELLLSLLNRESFWVLREAANSIIQMGEPGLKALRELSEKGGVSERAMNLIREAMSDAA